MADERPGAALSGNAKKAVAKKTSRRTAGGTQAAPAKKTPAKTTPTKKTPAKTTPARKTPAKNAGAKKVAGQKTAERATRTSEPATELTSEPTGTPVTTARDRVIRTGSSSGTSPHRSAPVRLASAAAGTTLQVAGLPARAARSVLDRRGGLPAYLGAGALAVGGVIEWPAAVGAGAGYAALRRWGGRLPQPLRSLTGSTRDR